MHPNEVPRPYDLTTDEQGPLPTSLLPSHLSNLLNVTAIPILLDHTQESLLYYYLLRKLLK